MYLYQKSADRMADKIAEAYRGAANHINSEMEKIFRTFRENSGLTVKEAKELLNERPTMIKIQNLREYAKQIKDPQKRQAVLNMLNAPAYAYRLERLERLQEDLDRQTRELAEFEQKATGQHYIDLAKRAYSRSMFDLQRGTGFLFPFPRMSTGRVLEILNYNWSGVTFSARIWGRSQEVNRAIREELLVQFMSNRSYRDTAREIERRMAVGAYEARRLVRTESTNIANMAEIESYRESGIQKFRFSAVLDMRTSEICASLDGKTFELEEAQTGVNVPPMHPFCRSSTVAVIDGETAADLKRRARDPKTGETYLVPADMTYRDWKKSVDEKYGEGTWDTERRKTVNRGSDKRQYEKYRNVLGRKNLPKSFDKFQDLKYNDKEGWNKLMRNKKIFSKIDDTDSYSPAYKERLKETYQYFKENGFEFTLHGLGRVVGQKQSKGKRSFSNEEALEVLKKPSNYVQEDGNEVKFYNGIAAIQAKDTGEIISVVVRSKIRSDWRKL